MAAVKYDRIGVEYDATRRADPRIADILVDLLEPQQGQSYVDVACGTGNYTGALFARGVDICGVDQSSTMLSEARAKHPHIRWHQADVAALPFSSGSFSGAVCTLAIHHFTDLEGAFLEIARVMRDGRFVLLTSTPEQMRTYWLNAYFPETLRRAMAQMPPLSAVEAALGRAGLRIETARPWDIPADPIDLFLYSGKHKPSLYLDPRVRKGISTFASLADPEEIASGLERLDADIGSGRIRDVMRDFGSGDGDYTFIAARKNSQFI